MAHLWVNDASSNRRKRWEEVGKCVHLWETRGPLSLGKYVLRYLKHQCQQQEKKLQVKSNFKFVHFKVPTVSLKMESTSLLFFKSFFFFKSSSTVQIFSWNCTNIGTSRDVPDVPPRTSVHMMYVDMWYMTHCVEMPTRFSKSVNGRRIAWCSPLRIFLLRSECTELWRVTKRIVSSYCWFGRSNENRFKIVPIHFFKGFSNFFPA